MALLAMSGGVYAVSLVFPLCTQKAIDVIVAGHEGPILIGFLVAVVAASAVEALLTQRRQLLVIDLAIFIDRRIARLAFAHLMRIRTDVGSFETGETMNRFQQARKIQSFVINELPSALFEGGNLVVSVAAIFYYDVVVGIAVVCIIPFVVMAVRSPLAAVQAASEDYYKKVSKQQNVLSETVHSLATIKSLARESVRMTRWTAATDIMLAGLRRVLEIQRRFIVTVQLSTRTLTVVVISVACLRLLSKHLTVGDLFALSLLSARVTGPLLQSSSLYNRFQDVHVAVRQIGQFLDLPKEKASIVPPLRALARGGVSLRDVSLTYPGRVIPALSHVSVDLPEAGVVAVVGRNGSGKSTMMRVLLAMLRTYAGRIDVGGRDLGAYDPRWLRGQLGVVDQDTVLFNGSIRWNLDGGRGAADDVLRNALAFAGALEFVDALPAGLDTDLTDNGRSLSGGQRQRLSIARAVVRDPRIALLDEPTAFLDAQAAVALEKRLAVWGRERLLIIVSHHLAATRDADRILVMEDGRLVGDGQHADLLTTTPSYAALWTDYTRGRAG